VYLGNIWFDTDWMEIFDRWWQLFVKRKDKRCFGNAKLSFIRWKRLFRRIVFCEWSGAIVDWWDKFINWKDKLLFRRGKLLWRTQIFAKRRLNIVNEVWHAWNEEGNFMIEEGRLFIKAFAWEMMVWIYDWMHLRKRWSQMRKEWIVAIVVWMVGIYNWKIVFCKWTEKLVVKCIKWYWIQSKIYFIIFHLIKKLHDALYRGVLFFSFISNPFVYYFPCWGNKETFVHVTNQCFESFHWNGKRK